MAQHFREGRFARLRERLAQALLRDPAVVLLDRDADERVGPHARPARRVPDIIS